MIGSTYWPVSIRYDLDNYVFVIPTISWFRYSLWQILSNILWQKLFFSLHLKFERQNSRHNLKQNLRKIFLALHLKFFTSKFKTKFQTKFKTADAHTLTFTRPLTLMTFWLLTARANFCAMSHPTKRLYKTKIRGFSEIWNFTPCNYFNEFNQKM